MHTVIRPALKMSLQFVYMRTLKKSVTLWSRGKNLLKCILVMLNSLKHIKIDIHHCDAVQDAYNRI